MKLEFWAKAGLRWEEHGTRHGWGLCIWCILSLAHSEVSTELPFRLMHPKPEEKNPAGQLYLIFAFFFLLLLLYLSHVNYYYCKAGSDLASRGLPCASVWTSRHKGTGRRDAEMEEKAELGHVSFLSSVESQLKAQGLEGAQLNFITTGSWGQLSTISSQITMQQIRSQKTPKMYQNKTKKSFKQSLRGDKAICGFTKSLLCTCNIAHGVCGVVLTFIFVYRNMRGVVSSELGQKIEVWETSWRLTSLLSWLLV